MYPTFELLEFNGLSLLSSPSLPSQNMVQVNCKYEVWLLFGEINFVTLILMNHFMNMCENFASEQIYHLYQRNK